MNQDMIRVTYLVETPGDPRAIAEKIASDQSTGTFTELPGETEQLKARCAARVVKVEPLADIVDRLEIEYVAARKLP